MSYNDGAAMILDVHCKHVGRRNRSSYSFGTGAIQAKALLPRIPLALPSNSSETIGAFSIAAVLLTIASALETAARKKRQVELVTRQYLKVASRPTLQVCRYVRHPGLQSNRATHQVECDTSQGSLRMVRRCALFTLGLGIV